ncbi:MAG: YceI family protein [Sphingobacteriia bacterium]|nr:YceI family protein [Sphingobacteriia bacterium]
MKIIGKFFALSLVIFLASCAGGGTKTETRDAVENQPVSYDMNYDVDTDKSFIEWEGYKPTGTHNGTVSISSGRLQFDENGLVGGTFTIDLNSIVVLDLTNPELNAQLRNHLISADFFEVETYPTATFEITGVETVDGMNTDLSKEKGNIVPTHAISGNLTMKNVTKNITFHARIQLEGEKIMAQTNQFFIDRILWNVQYGSKTLFAELKDNFINDEMGIAITLAASKSDKELSSK